PRLLPPRRRRQSIAVLIRQRPRQTQRLRRRRQPPICEEVLAVELPPRRWLQRQPVLLQQLALRVVQQRHVCRNLREHALAQAEHDHPLQRGLARPIHLPHEQLITQRRNPRQRQLPERRRNRVPRHIPRKHLLAERLAQLRQQFPHAPK